jgi:hypothetical protein
MSEETKSQIEELIDPRLIKRLRIYVSIMVIMLLVIVFDILMGSFSIAWALGGIMVGLGVGIIVSRMYHLSWDEDTNNVIGRIDWIGAIILIFYLVFVFSRTYYLSYYVQGTPLLALVFSITAGTMLGRVMSTERGIKKILTALNLQDKINIPRRG